MKRASAVVIAGLLAVACRGTEAAVGYTERDSAGVRIVESRLPRWSADEAWRVDSVPSLGIGVVSGPPELSFSGVSAVARLAEGSLLVADGATRELRVFDRDGRFVNRFGRQGSGPGEFEAISTMGVTGDTAWVYDLRAQRLTFLDLRSGGSRSVPLSLPGGPPALIGRRTDGSFVFAVDAIPFDPATGRMPTNGMLRPDANYLQVDPNGVVLDTLIVGKGQERIVRIYGERIELFRPLFNRTSSRAVRGDELIYSEQDGFDARVYGPDGTLLTIARLPDVDLALTKADHDAAAERLVGAAPADAQPGLRRLYGEQGHPAKRPAHARFLVGPDGELWIQDFTTDPAGSPTWSVLDADGVWLGTLALPERFRPTQIGRDEVLGVWRDELDVEQVRAYPLHRGAAR